MNTVQKRLKVDGIGMVEYEVVRREDFNDDPDQFTNLYSMCFADPPYYEKFSRDMVIAIANYKWFDNRGLVLAAREEQFGTLLSYLVAYPLTLERDVLECVEGKLRESEEILYIAEILTRPDKRRKHLANSLVSLLIEKRNWCKMLMRTSIRNLASQELFQRNGFMPIDELRQTVSQERVKNVKDKTPTNVCLWFVIEIVFIIELNLKKVLKNKLQYKLWWEAFKYPTFVKRSDLKNKEHSKYSLLLNKIQNEKSNL
jgi:hypothetical protein